MNEVLQDEREQTLFHACLELPAAGRQDYLERSCGSDLELRQRVSRLLADQACVGWTLFPWQQPAVSQDPDRIGSYRLLRVLGEGGTGTVYEAEQLEPVPRRVAVKILKPGTDTREVLARFMTERQALAALDHPYVAKVFDAGQTPGGRPYFVMELVEGIPLLEYCDSKRLSLRERVKLLILVCQGVQHAHQKGVLHRNLKPANILVRSTSPTPTPKIIDFGIAKAVGLDMLERATEYTRAGPGPGTPAYLSPEQGGFGQMDIDTRTDVYSLGVILYELLAGCLPADPADTGYARFLTLLANGELIPARPSARVALSPPAIEIARAKSSSIADLKRQLEGDLDWIVMKSLDVDRGRRYETVEALAEDLRKYLKGAPVAAHPPTISYQLRKFVERHRVGVAAGSVIGFALLCGAVAGSIGMVRASHAQAVATDEATMSLQVSDFLVHLFSLSSKRVAPGKPTTVRELLDRGAATIETDWKGQPAVQARLYATLSGVYDGLGQFRDSKRFAEKALALPQASGAAGEVQTANVLIHLGRATQSLGNREESRRLYQQALDIRLRVLGENNLETARALNELGSIDGLMERYGEATSAHRRALAIQRRVGGPSHIDVAHSLRGLALVQNHMGNVEAGLKLFKSAQEIFEKNYGPNHPLTAAGLEDIAVCLDTIHKPGEAQPLLKRSLDILTRVHGPNHPQVSFTEHRLGLVLIAQGKLREALPFLEDALSIRMATMGADNPRTADVAESLGTLWVSLGDVEKGQTLLEQALRAQERSYGPNHALTLETRGNLARTLVKAKRYDEALPHLRAIVLRTVPPNLRIDLQDSSFDPMRKLLAFQKLEEDMARLAETQNDSGVGSTASK